MGETPPTCQFGDYTLDVANARLWRAGQVVALPPKAFDLLALLLRRPGDLVSKDTLLDEVWGRRFVSEGAIKTVVSELRAALDDDVKAPRWIGTVPRRGYRFIGAVTHGDPPAPAPQGQPAPTRTNLPRTAARLIGRDAELASLLAHLAGGPLVTLVGPGGVGKTRLALAAAEARSRHHAGGAWWVDLTPLPAGRPEDAVLRRAVAHALQLAPAGLASDSDLCRALDGSDLLVVLDNAEHVLESLVPWLLGLQGRLVGVRWLLTSREPLQIAQEQVVRLEPLPVPALDAPEAPLDGNAALELFCERVAARLPGFVIQPAHRQAAVQLCRALEGLPLALELAAARVPALGVQGLAGQLAGDGARLTLLTQGLRDKPTHQRTLRAAIAWSCELLTPEQQQIFRRLSVFRGGFTLEAAQALLTGTGLSSAQVLEQVCALVDKSLLTGPPLDGAMPAAPRFSQLECLREYAFEQLVQAGEAETMQRRHLHAATLYWRAADDEALTQPVLPWTAAHSAELENLRSALRWGLAAWQVSGDGPDGDALRQEVVALMATAAVYLPRAGLAAEGAALCREVVARVGGPPPLDLPAWLQACLDLAQVTFSRFTRLLTPAAAAPLARHAAEVFGALGDPLRAYYAHYLAWTQDIELDERAGQSPALAAMRACLPADASPYLARFLWSAQSHEDRLAGRHETFLQSARQQWQLFQQLGAQGESWSAGVALMLAEHDAGQVDAALATGRALVADIRRAGRLRTYGQCATLHATMLAERATGDARAMVRETLPLMSSMPACEVLYLALAWLAWHADRPDDAARLLGWFESPQRGAGSPGEGTFSWRSAKALGRLLQDRLAPTRLAERHAEGTALGRAQAQALATGLLAD